MIERMARAMAAGILFAGGSALANSSVSDEAIRLLMIQNSISSYPGACPCPYSVMRNGSQCGKRSAWSKPGGRSPLCYPTDISDGMVKKYRSANGLN